MVLANHEVKPQWTFLHVSKRHFSLPKPLFPVHTTCSHLTWSNMPYVLDKALPRFYAPQQSSMIYKDWKVAVNICYKHILFTFTSDSTSKLTWTVRDTKGNQFQIQKRPAPLDHYLTHTFEKHSYHYNLTHLSKEVKGAIPVRMILRKYRKANSICGIFLNLSIYLCIMFWLPVMRLRNTKSSVMKISISH